MKCIKKVLALTLMLAMSFSLFTATAFAADDLTVAVGTVEAASGATVDVPVTVSNNSGILSAKLKFGFDAEQLELVKMTAGDVFTGDKVQTDLNTEVYENGALVSGKCVALFDNSTAADSVKTNGTLLTLTFQVKAEAGSCSITVEEATAAVSAEENITMTTVDGSVTVQESGVAPEGPSIEDVTSKPAALPEANITFEGSTMTIDPVADGAAIPACVVLAKDAEGNYTKISATANADGTYSYVIPEGATVEIAVKGDVDGNGKVNAADRMAIAFALLGADNTLHKDLSVLGSVVGDVDGNGKVNAADRMAIAFALLGSDNTLHKDIAW